MILKNSFYCYLFIFANLLFVINIQAQDDLYIDDYSFVCTDAKNSLNQAFDSGSTSFIFNIIQEEKQFNLSQSANSLLLKLKLDTINFFKNEIAGKIIIVFDGNYKHDDLKSYLTNFLNDSVLFAEWDQWPDVFSFQTNNHQLIAFLNNKTTRVTTDSIKINAPYQGRYSTTPLNKLTIFEPSRLEIDSLKSVCFNQWKLTGKVPNFIVVPLKWLDKGFLTTKALNESRRFKGEVKFNGIYLNEISWKQLPGTITPGKFSFPLLSYSTVLSPYKNGYKISPGEIIHHTAMKDIPRQFNAFKTMVEDELEFYFEFEKNAVNESETTWENIIINNTKWINDPERNKVVNFTQSNSFIDYSKENTLNFNTPISVSIWIKPDSILQFMGIIGFGTAFSIKLSNGMLDFTTATIMDHVMELPLPVNKWSQLGVVFNPGSTVDFYINGKQKKSKIASEIKPSQQSLVIGTNVWGEQFYGAMDDLMIWDRGLSETEFKELYRNQLSPQSKQNLKFILISILSLVAIYATYIVFRAKNKKQVKKRQKGIYIIPNKQKVNLNRIELFGTFNIESKSNGNISKTFSPLLKQLLVFLIIKTTTSENGITTKNINDNFWPGFTKNQAKENRGSSIKKLRNLLKQLTGADIVFRDKKWFFEVADYNYVDFIHYNNLKNIIKLQLKSETLSSKNIEAFLDILQKGNILQNIDSEWLDLIKNNISHEVTNLLSKIYSSKLTNNNLGISIAKTMLLFDDLNEEALQFLVQELISCGNHGQAKQTFEEFSRRFETLYNEPFPINYSSIQKRK